MLQLKSYLQQEDFLSKEEEEEKKERNILKMILVISMGLEFANRIIIICHRKLAGSACTSLCYIRNIIHPASMNSAAQEIDYCRKKMM